MNFRKVLKGAHEGEVVLPVLRSALWDPRFKSFQVKVRGFKPRPPDGYFHPSTHPLWPERMLYWYLVASDRLVAEPFDPISTMAVTQGHFWHTFIGKVGMEAGIFKAIDVPVLDEVTGARGEMDGVLDAEVFEFKTMRPSKVQKIERGSPHDPAVLASFRKLQPDYYAQGQEYMRMSGYRSWRGLILSMEYPFEMREIVMPYDDEHNYLVKEKYMRVRQAVADHRMPEPCCGPKSKESKDCVARSVCPVAVG